MKTIEAYKCNYCTKIYDTKSSCKSHEYRCYFNPRTKSCASCVCLKFDEYEYKSSHLMAIRTCIKNKDITGKLRTKCSDHLFNDGKNGMAEFESVKRKYSPLPFVLSFLSEIGMEPDL